jgi:hypothetical protein
MRKRWNVGKLGVSAFGLEDRAASKKSTHQISYNQPTSYTLRGWGKKAYRCEKTADQFACQVRQWTAVKVIAADLVSTGPAHEERLLL